ncbi:MAG: hypothetical protein K0U24_08045 [Gammaproteobacteria bacterium]|nr:hypothetical protein [Gammaproteobacteria bacterium]MCH9764152.1 hypothetical protein [Gammaproteobacteria bacterium]
MTADMELIENGKPRISGVLNNCLLNCALPSIIKQIEVYSKLSEEALLALNQDPIFKSYTELKQIFSSIYNLSKTEEKDFTWDIFARMTQNHSFYANELLFLPVLRAFVQQSAYNLTLSQFSAALQDSKKIAAHFSDGVGEDMPEGLGEDPDVVRALHRQLKTAAEISASGRYGLLDYGPTYVVFYNRLGLSLIANTAVKINKVDAFFQEKDYTQHPDYNLTHPVVELFFKNLHYELQEPENLAAATKQYFDDINQLPTGLKSIHEQITGASRKQLTEKALTDLSAYGNNYIKQMINPPAITPSLPIMPQQASSRFYFNCMLGLTAAGGALLVAAILLTSVMSTPFTTGLVIAGTTSLLLGLGLFVTDRKNNSSAPVQPELPTASPA